MFKQLNLSARIWLKSLLVDVGTPHLSAKIEITSLIKNGAPDSSKQICQLGFG